MILRRFLSSIACATVLAALTVNGAVAQPNRESAIRWNDKDGIPDDLVDAEFAQAIDLERLREAVRSLDQAWIVDAAVGLSQTEKKVGRSHRAISSDALFRLALRMAADARDGGAFERAAKAIASVGKPEFDAIVEQTRKLVSAGRKLDVPPDVPRGELTAEAILVYNACKKQVKAARVVGDSNVLRDLRGQLGDLSELHPKQRVHLQRMIDESLVAIAPRPDAEQLALSRLTGFSTRSTRSER
ncbi:MAG: hypothetical protein FJ297_11330 [Planctomycetes bacterium]|nr:hypothetical protein [Planctomycetota bacterium]